MTFRVCGPFPLKTETIQDTAKVVHVRCVDRVGSKKILDGYSWVRNAGPGVYVFAIRKQGGPGFPWYVGITEKEPQGSLVAESLHSDKLRKYASALAEAGSGNAILYVLLPTDLRQDNLARVESFLIWLGRQRNPRLINQKKVSLTPESLNKHLQSHKIAGMLNSNQGNPGIGAGQFKAMIGWQHPMHIAGT